ncbi:hypothetical protein DRH14_02335 [Candidatus Shapirobacteria bacterium]|nr:MAG: hypothetical protein DRH14_02335 [Candidatus Shapirobacteria bacterium]
MQNNSADKHLEQSQTKNLSTDSVSTQSIRSLPNQRLIKNNKILLVFLLGMGGLIFFYQKKVQQRKSSTIQDVVKMVSVENGIDENIFSLLKKNNYESNDPIYVKAYGNWGVMNIGEISIDIPVDALTLTKDHNPNTFSKVDQPKVESFYLNKKIYVEPLARGYIKSPYYQSINKLSNEDNSSNLVGGLIIKKVTFPENLTADAFVKIADAQYNKTECESDGSVYVESKIRYLDTKSSNLVAIEYVPNMCYPPGGAFVPLTHYLAQLNNNLYFFDGGHEPLPEKVIEKIVTSVKSSVQPFGELNKKSTIGELTIKHPSNWYVNKFEYEYEKIKGFNISNYEKRYDCKDYQSLSVSYLGKNRYSGQANTAKQYVDTDYEVWSKEEKKNIEKGLLPTTPGYVETYYRDASYIFNPDIVDAVELKTLGNEGFKFLILKNDQVYQISFHDELNSDNKNKAVLDDANPIIQMLKTVTINGEFLM